MILKHPDLKTIKNSEQTETQFFAVLSYFIRIYITSILFFTSFRIILYLVNIDMAGDDTTILFPLRALLNGLQFDSLIASFIISIPLVALSIIALCNRISKTVIVISNSYLCALYAPLFIISIADIPYFSYSFTHISIAAFGWFEYGSDTTRLLFQEITYYPYLALIFISIIAFTLIIRNYGRKLLQMPTQKMSTKSYKYYIPLTLLIWGICFVGMRGSFQRYPLRVDHAYFSNNSFFNQLGINPSFFLLKSISFKPKTHVNDLMATEKAIALVQKELNIVHPQNDFPLRRDITVENVPQKKRNAVIILLESMAAKYLECEYEGKTLTPYLHELIERSYYFRNFYSAGVHTNNGIVSTLYGYPALFDEHSMGSSPQHYDGLPLTLQKHGYRTLFFLGGNSGFDHMNAFLYTNGFNRIYSQENYPTEKRVNNFGVQDDYLLDFALTKLSETAKEDKPFLATILTVSNHVPYIVPEKYKDAAETNDKRILRFVDDAIKDFMTKASTEAWFENTIFILLGDHGKIFDDISRYEMPLTLNHIPLIVFSKNLLKDSPQIIDSFGNQTDIFPTVMDMLELPYTNNSFGINLLKESRPCVYFVNDNQLGCIDSNFLYIRNLPTKKDILYNLTDNNPQDLFSQEQEIAQKLKDYAVSMIISADGLIKNNRTRVP
ncbi:MAG: sulfatase-like hydrolase/transferase [Tannerellaceae bacterium]|jgi:phosphoglycerol transferase MdoB-like AlkP superfamily enzyme|nr:sulfatase-like hydrolase/transferase [Tannerellaceae bacterium]